MPKRPLNYGAVKATKALSLREKPGTYLLRGHVVMAVLMPNRPNDPHVPRPVVVVSTNSRNRNYDAIIVVPLSHGISNPHKDLHIYVAKGEGGMRKDGFARCDLICTLDKDFLDLERGPLGEPLSDRHMWAIARGIRKAVGDREK